MPMSDFISELRRKIGNDLLQLPTVTVLIFDHRDRVLLVRHIDGDIWSTPGGMVEPGETPSDAALREVWEETGLSVRLARIVGVFGGTNFMTTYTNGDRVSWISTVFEATIVSGEPRPDNQETAEVRYFSNADLNGVACTPHVEEVLAVARSRAPDGYFQPPGWTPPGGA